MPEASVVVPTKVAADACDTLISAMQAMRPNNFDFITCPLSGRMVHVRPSVRNIELNAVLLRNARARKIYAGPLPALARPQNRA
jgi:hypothetical protein